MKILFDYLPIYLLIFDNDISIQNFRFSHQQFLFL